MSSILKVDEIQDTSGNNIINENSNTITIGASGDTITIPSGATITNSGTATGFGGITEADQWRVTANVSGASAFLTANWERVDSTGFGYLGTGMSQSSGVFTFPSTGIYLVKFHLHDQGGSSFLNSGAQIHVTTNNSSYTQVTEIKEGAPANDPGSMEASYLLDVTDTSNVKVKFYFYHGDSGSTVIGNTNYNSTYVTFIRLGDT